MAEPKAPTGTAELRDQFGPSYDRFGPAESARHTELLDTVGSDSDVALDVQEAEQGHWTVTVCTWDWLGTLSILSGLMSIHGLSIEGVDVFTFVPPAPLREPAPPGRRPGLARRRLTGPVRPRGKGLDIFTVRTLNDNAAVDWGAFFDDLKSLVGLLVEGLQDQAREEIIDRYTVAADAIDQALVRLSPVFIDVDNSTSSDYTLLEIRSEDTPGFLFAFTNAMAVLSVNVARAEIRTIGDKIQDRFWLTDQSGRKIRSESRIREIRSATVLIKEFTHLLPLSPNPTQALRQFQALVKQMLSTPQWAEELADLESTTVLETLAGLMGVSQFLWDDFLRMQHENLYPVLVDTPALELGKSLEQIEAECRGSLSVVSGHDDRVKQLNRYKDREMFRIDLRHITGRITFEEFSRELASLAEVVVGEAAGIAQTAVAGTLGAPMLEGGRPCRWCICALGKFGGRELGFGSDVELLFVYEDEGVTGGEAPAPNSVYFANFVREFLRCIVVQREGIFEVDLRLRPYSNDGPLASSLDGFRAYYSPEGYARQFERLSMVKLRPVAGDPRLGEEVCRRRDSFVYSGADLDLENIRHLRRRQAAELVAPGAVSAKYSAGGLVDVEYFVQASQILAGNQDVSVRQTNTLEAIRHLGAGGYLDAERARNLEETYGFLRRLIDALRAVRGHAKDLTIPDAASAEYTYLARRLGFSEPAGLRDAVAAHMEEASEVWSHFAANPAS